MDIKKQKNEYNQLGKVKNTQSMTYISKKSSKQGRKGACHKNA